MVTASESERLRTLRAYDILDTPPEPVFDGLARVAAHLCETPISIITLLDERRQWFKAAVGMPFRGSSPDIAFCAHTVASRSVFIVPDASRDARFANHPFVIESPYLRFYAGIPLIAPNGAAVGALAVCDRKPRRLKPRQIEMLELLARQTTTQLEARRERLQLRASELNLREVHEQLRFHLRNSPIAQVEWDEQFRVSYWSPQAETFFGWEEGEVLGLHPSEWPFVHPEDMEAVSRVSANLLGGVLPRTVSRNRNLTRDGRVLNCEWLASVSLDRDSNVASILSFVVDRTDEVQNKKKLTQALARERQSRIEVEGTRQQFHALLESAPGCYLILNPSDDRVVAVNHEFIAELGVDREDFIEQSLLQVLNTLLQGTAVNGIARLRRSLSAVRRTKRSELISALLLPVLAAVDESGVRQFQGRKYDVLVDPILNMDRDLGFVIFRIQPITRGALKAGAHHPMAAAVEGKSSATLPSHELHRLNRQLATSEAQFRSLLEDAATGIVTLTLGGRYLSANKAYCNMLGYSESALRATNWLELTHRDDQALIHEYFDAALVGGGRRSSFVLTHRQMSRHKEAVWVRASFAPQRGAHDHIDKLICVAEDITKERHATEKLRENMVLSRLAERVGRIGGWAFDMPSNTVYWSEEIYKMLGWRLGGPPSIREVIGQVARDDRAKIIAALRRCSENGTPFNFELETDTAKGTRLWVRVVGEAEHDERDDIVRLVGACQDISIYKAAESEQEQLSRQLSEILENMSDGFCLLDREWRFRYINKRGERILRQKEGTLTGEVVWDKFPETRDMMVYDAFLNAVRERQPAAIEFFYSPAQEWLHISANPTEDGLAVYFRTTTEQRALEDKLKQAQRLEAVGQLTGGVAHDFNNLLTVILGNAEMLRERLEGNHQLQKLTDLLLHSAQRGAELTQQLLIFARRQTLVAKHVDIRQLVDDMLPLLRRALGEQYKLDLNHESDHCLAHVDAGQLENALLNLCLNARDAMPSGGVIRVTTSHFVLDEEAAKQFPGLGPGEYTEICVVDSGGGISKDNLEHVFEPFFTTKEVGRGTGLGLSMVYGFARQSHGDVAIRSVIDKGTEVSVYLPASMGASDSGDGGQSVAVADYKGSNELVLLVEDDPLVRQYAHSQLESLGYKIITAHNGRIALEILKQRTDVDLLFTDVVMSGGLNGRDLALQARKLYPALPVLLCSGYTEQVAIPPPPDLADIALLRKPYLRGQLSAAVHSAIVRHDKGA